jgi:hypothetical protein
VRRIGERHGLAELGDEWFLFRPLLLHHPAQGPQLLATQRVLYKVWRLRMRGVFNVAEDGQLFDLIEGRPFVG